MGSTDLAGWRILVPRAGTWGARVADTITRRGGVAVVAPLIEARPPLDLARRDDLLAKLQAGAYEWLFVTSASTVEQFVDHAVTVPAHTRIAAVGRATAHALVSAGFHVDFLPSGPTSARNLITQWCAQHRAETTGRCLVARGDLAMAAVSDELDIQGFDADVAILYRTVGVDLDPSIVTELSRGEITAVLLTAGSVARELASQVAELSQRVARIAIGRATADAALKVGLQVTAIAEQQTVDSMLERIATLDHTRWESTR